MLDTFGYEVTSGSADAVEALNRARRSILSHSADTMDHVGSALEADPNMPLTHALRGLLMLTLARRELVSVARDALEATEVALQRHGGTVRERVYASALALWLDNKPDLAAARLSDILPVHPCDSLTAKLVQAIRFMTGDQRGMRTSIESVLDRIGEDHPEYGYLLGCHAFTLEETGEYERAEAVGRRGVALAPDDAWGIHAVAHVHDMTRRPEEGIEWVSRHHADWSHCNNFKYHLFWHLALFHLEQREFGRVLEIYDNGINAIGSDDYRDIANSASLLARLSIEGVDCGLRWKELAEMAARRLDDEALAFADLHYLMAMTGAGRLSDADRLSRRLAKQVGKGGAAEAAAFAASGLAAFAHGQHQEAFDGLSRALPVLMSVGGSHAQRDVFERLAIEAGMRAGAYRQTKRLIETRNMRRRSSDSFADARLAVIQSHQNGHAGTDVWQTAM